jgi:N4-gp56 family major capsid protein
MSFNTLAGLRASSEVDDAISGGTQMPFATRAWYNKVFLSVAEPKLVHDRHGMPTTLPKHTGEQVIWRRWLKLATNVVPLSEGIPPTGKNLAYENVLGTVKWYGDWVAITDVVDFMHVDKVLTIATKRLALQAAESMDEVTRDVINAGTSFLRVTADGSSPTTGVGARTTVAGTLTKRVLDTAITQLEAADAEYILPQMNASTKVATQPIGPSYVAIIHPHVVNGIVNTLSGMGDDWVPREKYAGGTVAYPSEVGKYRNVRFVTSTVAKVFASSGGTSNVGSTAASTYRSTDGTNGDVYSVLILAKEAYGTVKLQGASMTYYDRAGGNSDPLHQKSTAGWKACKTAVILNDNYLCRIECLATW